MHMNTRFEKILVPVDFSINTEVAVHQALCLAEPWRAVIHLLHVQDDSTKSIVGYNLFSVYNRDKTQNSYSEAAAEKLCSLERSIQQMRKDITVCKHIISGVPIEVAVINKAREIMPDLILIAKRSHHSLLPFLNTVVPSRVAMQTWIPVLISKPGSLHRPIKTIVMPIGAKFPQRKIEIINALRKKAGLHIRLLTFSDDDPRQVQDLLIHVYRLLRNGSFLDIQYETIAGRNKAKAILKYCEKVEADLVVVTPDLETRIGWMNTHISDVIPAASRTQVLAI